jgi:uncharacterized protein YbjT (DUF2867 family)
VVTANHHTREEHTMNAGTRIAVAGATGRLGRHLVDVLGERGYEVVRISRTDGVDVVSGEGLAEALAGVDTVIDAAAYPSNEQEPATDFFVASARNLQELGAQAGVRQLVVVSIIGIDRFTTGFLAAKKVHEHEVVKGQLPVRLLRAAQFHEFVEPLLSWMPQENGVKHVPNMRTQLVAARTVAEALVDLATDASAAPASTNGAVPEVAGPRAETLAGVAKLVAERQGEAVRIEGVTDPEDPDGEERG